jgi:hypothetical protein
MRCRNCHTVMMDTDPECPTCHASAASATSAPPGPINKPSGLLLMLPAFGGAIGGALYGALTIGQRSASRVTHGHRGSSPLKWVFGLFLIVAGGLFLAIALVQFCDVWEIGRREPRAVTAAELRRTEDPKSLSGAWIAYTFDDSKPTELTVTRSRLGHGGDVKARCLLVRVEDK